MASAIRIFEWLLYSQRPMTMLELVDAIAIVVGDKSMDPDVKLNEPEDITHICGGLIDLNRQNMTLGLAHFTVKEYLISTNIARGPAATYQIRLHTANVELTKTCLTYILFSDFSAGPCSTEEEFLARLDEYPLLRYAPYYWPKHIHECGVGNDKVLDDLVLSFFRLKQDSGSFLSWWQLYHAGRDNLYNRPARKPENLLYLAAQMGQHPAVRELLEGGADINADCYEGTALFAAAKRGHLETVQILLEKGRGLLEEGLKKYKPLRAPMTEASKGGFGECVQLLLDYGTEELSEFSSCCRDALGVLPLDTPGEREHIMEIFLATKHFRTVPTAEETDVPIADMPDFLGAFMCSVACGWERCSRSMFGIGSDVIVSATGGKFLDVCLHYIIERGHVKLLKMIMQHDKARAINTKHDKHRSHLQKAAYFGQEKIVEFLLSLKEASGIEGLGISLHVAAAMGHIGIMERLLRAGANPLHKDDHGWSPLLYASLYLENVAIQKLSVLAPISLDLSLKTLEVETTSKNKLIYYNLLIDLVD